MRVEGLDKIQKALQHARQKFVSSEAVHGESVIVGFTASYAVYVHENLQAHHPVGQAKFLEQPARTLSGSGEIGRIVAEAIRGGAKPQDGLLLAGRRIQREAQQLCPVDTGNLKGSAFTRKE